jgi:hypothetical protein
MASRHLDNQRAHRRSACPYWAGRVLLRDDHSITLSAGEQAERTILKLPTPFLEAKAISSGKARVVRKVDIGLLPFFGFGLKGPTHCRRKLRYTASTFWASTTVHQKPGQPCSTTDKRVSRPSGAPKLGSFKKGRNPLEGAAGAERKRWTACSGGGRGRIPRSTRR